MSIMNKIGTVGLAALITLSGCGGGGGSRSRAPPEPPPPQNQQPTVTITRSFDNNGMVRYQVVGEDLDGRIVELRTQYNNEPEQRHMTSGTFFDKPITQETNLLAAIAKDDHGLESDPLVDILEIPSRPIAYEHIKMMLDAAGNFDGYRGAPERVPIYLGNEQLNVLFEVRRGDLRYSVIDYVAPGENINRILDDHDLIYSFHIDNLLLYLLPFDEIANFMTSFINADYRTDFDP